MARGSIGRERMMSGVISAHQPPASGHQEDLNNELNKVSPFEFAACPANVTKTPANCQFADRIAILMPSDLSRTLSEFGDAIELRNRRKLNDNDHRRSGERWSLAMRHATGQWIRNFIFIGSLIKVTFTAL